MSKKYVYLAGPISGESYAAARYGWRLQAHTELKAASEGQIIGLSPMRQHHALENSDAIPSDMGEGNSCMDSNKGIVAKDRFDCLRSDLIIANFAGSTRASLGTAIEFGWADSANIPVIMVVEPGNIHNHAMLLEMASFIVPTVDEAIDVALQLLSEEA